MLSKERTLLSDASINAIRNVKDSIRVAAADKAHQMPITPVLMQGQRTTNSVYVARLAEERKKAEINNRLQEKRTAEKEEIQKTVKLLEVR